MALRERDCLLMSELLYGRHAVLEALRAQRRRVYRLWVESRSDPARATGALAEILTLITVRSLPSQTIQGGLFDRLRSWRFATAKERNVPAYVVFPDATLREIAINRPQSLSELAGISGVGDRKLEQYGAAILELVAEAG